MADHKEKRFLIVGGCGYLGSRLAEFLAKEAEVTVTGRSLTPSREAWLGRHTGKIRFLHFNSSVDTFLRVEEKFTAVFNLAMPSAGRIAEDFLLSQREALSSLHACLNLLVNEIADRLFQVSSFRAYGAHPRRIFSETDPLEPTHPYGVLHRLCEENLIQAAPQASACIIRPTNVVGSPAHEDLGPQGRLIFFDLCRQAVTGRSMVLMNNGQAYRDFLSMTDFLRAIQILLDHSAVTRGMIPIYNISRGVADRLEDFARLIQREAKALLGTECSLRFGTDQDAFVHPFTVTHEPLSRLGWAPHDSLRMEVRNILTFFRDIHAKGQTRISAQEA